MELAEPSAIGVAFLAVAIVYVIVREVIVPKVKTKTEDVSGVGHPPSYFCQAGKYENRIATLESRCTSNDQGMRRLEAKIDRNSEKIDEAARAALALKSDMIHVREIVEWIKTDRQNGGT